MHPDLCRMRLPASSLGSICGLPAGHEEPHGEPMAATPQHPQRPPSPDSDNDYSWGWDDAWHLAHENIAALRAQLDAANAALTAVTDLLDEARAERDAARGELHDAIEFRRAEQRRLSADALRAAAERDNALAGAKRLRTENQRLQDQRNELADEVMRYRAELRGMGRDIAGGAL